jgi:hypothetical protein
VYAPHAQQYDSGSRFNDAAEWSRSATDETAVDILEPLHFAANSYREASLANLRVLLAIDQFVSAASDARLSWVSVGFVLQLESVRGLSKVDACRQMKITERRLECSIARFRKVVGIAAGDGRHPLGLPVRKSATDG